MADFVSQLRRDPYAVQSIKPNSLELLRSIFLAIPEPDRRGVPIPERGYQIKQWLEEWSRQQVAKRRGDSPDEPAIPRPTVARAAEDAMPRYQARRNFLQESQNQHQSHIQGQHGRAVDSLSSVGRSYRDADSPPDPSNHSHSHSHYSATAGASLAHELRLARRARLSARFDETAPSSDFASDYSPASTAVHASSHQFSPRPRGRRQHSRGNSPPRSLSDDEDYASSSRYASRRSMGNPRQDLYDDGDGDFDRDARTSERKSHRHSSGAALSHRTPLSSASASRHSHARPCPNCAASERKVARLTRVVNRLLDQLEGIALDLRGEVTRAVDSQDEDEEIERKSGDWRRARE